MKKILFPLLSVALLTSCGIFKNYERPESLANVTEDIYRDPTSMTAVLETAEANNATEVNEVTVEVGRLAMINPEQLEFILGVLVENTIMQDAEIRFEEIPAEMTGKSLIVK